MLRFFMDFIILVSFLQILSFVNTNEISNSTNESDKSCNETTCSDFLVTDDESIYRNNTTIEINYENSTTLSSRIDSNYNEANLHEPNINNDIKVLIYSWFTSYIKNLWSNIIKSSDVAKNVKNSSSNGTNDTALKILRIDYKAVKVENLSTSNNSFTTESIIWKSQKNDEEIIEDVLINNQVDQKHEFQSKNDSLILEIDTPISSTTQLSSSINNEITENTMRIKNNIVNDESTITIISDKTITQNYNDSQTRLPFSSRYSQVNNSTSGEGKKLKRQIPFGNEYNSIDRQELASYYYNNKKLHENDQKYAKPQDQDNLSSNIYNPDLVYDGAMLDPYPPQSIHTRNQVDNNRESYNHNQQSNVDIAQNFHTDINDSSLWYFVDRLGHSILDNYEAKFITTEKNNEKIIYSNNDLYQSPTATQKKNLQLSTRKSISKKNTSHKRRSNSIRKKKNKLRARTKARKNKTKNSIKSQRRSKSKKIKSNSSKYSRSRSKYKRKNNKRNMLKKKKKLSRRKTDGRKKSRKNRKNSRQ